MAVPLSKQALLERIAHAIYVSGWSLLYETKSSSHPFKLRMFKDGKSYSLLIYIWSLTHGGGKARPKNEYRIQMTGVSFPLLILPNCQTLLLGWHEELETFVGFDIHKHRNSVSRSPSIQVHYEVLEKAGTEGLAFQRKGNDEIAIAFVPEHFANYVADQENLHLMAALPAELELMEQTTSTTPFEEELIEKISEERRVVTSIVARKFRQSSFSRRVLSAYRHHCAICDLQLDLLDAGHIIPVEIAGSNDETYNGMALCKNHHFAYDNNLLKVDEHYRIYANQTKIKALKDKKRIGGLEVFLSTLREEIRLPESLASRPRPEYLRRGMELRERF